MSPAFQSISLVLFLFLTSNTLWFQPICKVSVSALGNETDHLALLRFKESIRDDPFQVLNSWNTSTHFCNWHGVSCGHRHQRVTVLNLTGYHLHGFLSPHIANLSFLRILSIRNNSFYGEVPEEFGRLFRLQRLFFSNNTLEGEFPISLTNCSELRSLSLQVNHFTGRIPIQIGSLGKLEKLFLSINNLSGQIPASIGNLSSLTLLSMASNNLEGNIPKEIGQLKGLTKIGVGDNKLYGMLPSSFFNLSSLDGISFTADQFNGSLPANMFISLPNLYWIEMEENQFSGQIPTSITNASRIQLFDITGNHFVGEVPSLGKHLDLFRLNLASNHLGSNSSHDWKFLKSLRNCTQLKLLDIAYNNFGGPLPSYMANLSTQLTNIYLGGNQISGKILPDLGIFVNLILLGLQNNHLTGNIPNTFGSFQKMQLLSLAGNKLSGEIPNFIGNLSQLFKLDLSINMFIGKIPSSIGNCRNLQWLDLSLNNLSGAIPSEVIGLSSLSTLLNLSHNSLSSTLPSDVGMLKSIDKLDVSGNYLSGAIPETIGECTSLEYLYLQSNSIHGTIPSSLASLRGLLHLDLSLNNLSGSIPKALENVSSLEYFNASFNLLEGEVPTTGVFGNATRVSVTGNEKLCGGVPKLHLSPCPIKATTETKHHNLKLIVVIICSVVFLLVLSCFVTIYLSRKRHIRASSDSIVDQLPKVSYQSLHNATAGFSRTNLIGTGSIGYLYKGRLDSSKGIVAIKVLNLQKKGAHKSFIAECNALRNIRHRNLVKIFTCCSSMDYNGNEFKALVFEYMSNGSLEEWLHPEKESAEQSRTLNLKKRLEIVIDIAYALHYLHYECGQHIIHCDLKPSNVLLNNDMVAHVSDFGLARLLSTINGTSHKESSTTGMKGTIGYAPPEYGMSSQISIEGDLYSFGILLLEMLTGRRPTHEMFKDGRNLHDYVKAAFPNNMSEIIDPTILLVENEHLAIRMEENNFSNIAAHLHPDTKKCLLSLFSIGLACSMESPRERMNMMEVVKELHIIKK